MGTSEGECLDALQAAADRLGESPSKADYEALDLRPASATIIRVVSGWNEAKEQAGLETTRSTGSRVGPKPEDADLPSDTDWADLSVDQRWHYRNVGHNTARTLERRRRLRSWVNDRKEQDGVRSWLSDYKRLHDCSRCGETDPRCLVFHHESDNKRDTIANMVSGGRSKRDIERELTKCILLCANCHRAEHYTPPEPSDETDTV
ncbi:MAG: HNH endonuclease [Halovenus sp.]